MQNIRTDMADEMHDIYCKGRKESNVEGVEYEVDDFNENKITRVNITNENGANAVGKPIGKYITLDIPDIKKNKEEINENIATAVSNELKDMLKIDKTKPILIVGLGNWNVTPDSVGPKIVDNITITRHLIEYAPWQLPEGTNSVCAIAPGVLGITGIETGEIIKGIVDRINPSMVIAIDALASSKVDRIGTSVQISNTGINPGSGIGNKRMALNQESLGVPVVALGVPTVVDVTTITNDTLNAVIENVKDEDDEQDTFFKSLKKFKLNQDNNIIPKEMTGDLAGMVVTPKEIDQIIENITNVISQGIDKAIFA